MATPLSKMRLSRVRSRPAGSAAPRSGTKAAAAGDADGRKRRPAAAPASQVAAGAAFGALPEVAACINKLHHGWSIRRFVFVLPPLVLAELEHQDDDARTDQIAYWVFSRNGHFLGNQVTCIAPDLARQVRVLLLSTIAARPDEPEPYARLASGLLGLDRSFRLALLRHLWTGAPEPILTALGYGPDQEHRFAITGGAGGLALLIDNDLEWPISIDNEAVPDLQPGWSVSHIVTCFAPLVMLELRHPEHAEVTWAMDSYCRRIGGGADFFHPDIIGIVRRVAPGMMRRHWRQIIALEDLSPDHVPLPMLALNADALRRVLDCVREIVAPVTVDQMLADPQPPIVLPPTTENPDGLVLAGEHVTRAVRHSLFEAGLQAVRQNGQMTWPSPVDGSDAALEAVFVPQEYTMIYQFRDRNGLRFMVASGERDCVQLGLYLPDENRFLCDTTAAGQWFRTLIPAEFWVVLYEHCLLSRDILAGRARGDRTEIVNVFMAQPLLHIGHYVWNDLSGQAAVARALGDQTPRSMILQAPDGEAEFFGPIDTLFPELAGKVDRRWTTKADFIRHVYETGIVPIRLTRSFVDNHLRDVVRRHVGGTECWRAVQQTHAGHGGGPVLIAGLRLEDRTFANPAAFYEGLVDHLNKTRPGTVLVMDGRNARPGGRTGEFIASIKDHHAIRSPLQVEQDLVARLQHYADGRNVRVVSTVGLPVEASMAWCFMATACISPWGAGLAKYRWLANLPSVVLTSRFNLLHRHDLDIYHAPNWMESPAPMMLPDPDQVADRLDIAGNAPADTDASGRECFEIDLPHVWSLLDPLLDRTGPSVAGSHA